MGCHRIGLGMNSVVEKSIEMFKNEEIGLNACKKIIVACRNGVYWCDGNEDEAIACIIDCYQHLVYEESILKKHVYVEKKA